MRARWSAATAVLLTVVLSGCVDASGSTGAVPRERATRTPTATESAPTARQTPQPPCRDTTPRQRGETLLRTLPDSWRASGATVAFAGPRTGVMGETTVTTPPRVTVYVRPCAEQTDELLRHVIAHELGHAWDHVRMTSALRDEYLRMRRISSTTPWFGCSGCEDFATPAGDFAETYAQWLRGSTESRSELAPAATPEQLADLARRFFG